MKFQWFYRLCKKRELTVAQELERLARRERFAAECFAALVILFLTAIVWGSCHGCPK